MPSSADADDPFRAPPPPDDLPARQVPLREDVGKAGDVLWRLHRAGHAPLHFGPRRPPSQRFDAPDGSFGTLYLAAGRQGAIVETLLRNPARTVVDRAEAAVRRITAVRVVSALRLADLAGAGLGALGTTAAVATGRYEESRAWAAALLGHPDRPDGIAYRSRHDPDELCVALFDRAAPSVVAGEPEEIDPHHLAAALRRYGKVLV